EGERQASAAAKAFRGIRFDRVLTSGLARTLATASIVVPDVEPESWPELRELEPGRLSVLPADELEEAFVGRFHGVVPEQRKFLGGETIGSLLDRVLTALGRLLSDTEWDVAVAIVPVAGRGIGREHALALAHAGAKVVVNDLGAALSGEGSDQRPAEEVAGEIGESGGQAAANCENVADFAGAERLIRQAIDEF